MIKIIQPINRAEIITAPEEHQLTHVAARRKSLKYENTENTKTQKHKNIKTREQNCFNDKKGFTLIELIIYIGLVSIMLLGITSFTKVILQTRERNQVIAEVEQQGVQIAQILTQTIRNAENIIRPVSSNAGSDLVLDVFDASKDPTIFSLDGNVINIKEGADSQINLNNSRIEVQNLTFQNLSRPNTSGIIKFSFTLNYNNQSSRPEYNYYKTFYGSTSLR